MSCNEALMLARVQIEAVAAANGGARTSPCPRLGVNRIFNDPAELPVRTLRAARSRVDQAMAAIVKEQQIPIQAVSLVGMLCDKTLNIRVADDLRAVPESPSALPTPLRQCGCCVAPARHYHLSGFQPSRSA